MSQVTAIGMYFEHCRGLVIVFHDYCAQTSALLSPVIVLRGLEPTTVGVFPVDQTKVWSNPGSTFVPNKGTI